MRGEQCRQPDRLLSIGLGVHLHNPQAVQGESLRATATLARDPRKGVPVADRAVVELGGEMVRRRGARADLERVAAPMAEGRLDPHVVASYPFSRATEALALVEGAATRRGRWSST